MNASIHKNEMVADPVNSTDHKPDDLGTASWPSSTITLISKYYSGSQKKLVEFTTIFGAFVSLFLQISPTSAEAKYYLRLVQAFLLLIFGLLLIYLVVSFVLFIVAKIERNRWTIPMAGITIAASGFFTYNLGRFTYAEFLGELHQYWIATSVGFYVLAVFTFDRFRRWVKENPESLFSKAVSTTANVLNSAWNMIVLSFINLIFWSLCAAYALGNRALTCIIILCFVTVQIGTFIFKRKNFFQDILMFGFVFIVLENLIIEILKYYS